MSGLSEVNKLLLSNLLINIKREDKPLLISNISNLQELLLVCNLHYTDPDKYEKEARKVKKVMITRISRENSLNA